MFLISVFLVAGFICGSLMSPACRESQHRNGALSGETTYQQRLKDEVSVLIDGLLSTNMEERVFCSKRLRAITGLCFDYNPMAAEEKRAEGVRRWRIWWSKAKKRPPDMWLADAVLDGSYRYRAEAAYRIGRRREREGIDALKAVLNDGDARVREAAVAALGMLKERSVVDELAILAVGDKDASVRIAAANSLCTIGESGWHTLASISEELRDTPALLAAVDALSLLPTDENRNSLERVLKRLLLSGDRSSMQFAVQRIGALGISGLEDELLSLRETTDEVTKRLINTALKRLSTRR